MKYLIIYHNGNGEITKEDLVVEEVDEEDVDSGWELDEDFVCKIPLDWVKEKLK